MTSTIQGFVASAPSGVRAPAVPVSLATSGAVNPISITTDREGWFAFTQLPAGRYRVSTPGARSEEIALDRYSTITLELAIPEYNTREHGSIAGKVVAVTTGYPIENASVMVLHGAGSAPDIAPLTNAQGRFSLEGLAAGEWRLRVFAPSGQTATPRIEVRANETAMVTVVIGGDSDNCGCTYNME